MKYFISAVITFMAIHGFTQTDILDARTNFSVGQEVTVTGIVTNGASLGSVRYIQDESAGVAIYPGTTWDGFDEPQIGDEITVTGDLSEFIGLLEVGPDLSDVTINSSDNDLPEFQILNPDDLDEDLEGELVQVEACFFDNGGVEIQSDATYSYTSNGELGVVYFRSSNSLVGTVLPAGETTISGVLSQFSFDGFGGYQLLPRDTTDFISNSSINLASSVEQENITQTSFDLSWLTDASGDSKVEYGLTPDLGSSAFDAEISNTHTVSLTGLEAGKIYFAKVMSFLGEDTAQSQILPFATVSNSSGEILAYFTGSVETSVATVEDAVSLGASMKDTIAAYIMNAEHTLDMAIYNINNSVIVNAINTANDNGVQVRYIAQGTNANFGIGDFDSGIPVHYREDEEGSGMHNKFVIVDADYEDKAVLLTGSTNFTTEGLVNDFNNVIIFKDQSIARGYRIEFEEMWGGSGAEPNAGLSVFGAAKSNNTPKKYIVGGSPVEVYFSPSDNTTAAIEEVIYTADYDLEFALLAFTRDNLGEAIIDVSSIFLQPIGIIEQSSGTGTEFDNLVDEGIEVYSHLGVSGQLHHKYCIVDQSQDGSDPIILTGSHNWSSSAENSNDENTVVVHDARVANLYYQEFYARLIDLGVGIEEEKELNSSFIYPNPASEFTTIYTKGNVGERMIGELIDNNGRLLKTFDFTISGKDIISLAGIPHGLYHLRFQVGDESSSQKIVIR